MLSLPKRIIYGNSGEVKYLLGNEAIARGALEGGVAFASGYPGTPSTEILEALSEVANDYGIYVEWSINEKIAYESAIAASMSGLRAMTTMKHVGVNVAADPLMSSAYAGVVGGLILVAADDPSMHSSQNEQDSRIYGFHSYIPVIEPSNPQECKDYIPLSLNLSEKFDLPIIFRTTTRISHSRGRVIFGEVHIRNRKGEFKRDIEKWVMIPSIARKRRIALIERFNKLSEECNFLNINEIVGNGKELGIITGGSSYSYVSEALSVLDLWKNAKVLKLGMVYPLPRKKVLNFVDDVDKVLIIEELEPFIEKEVKVIMLEERIFKEIHGKDLIPLAFELTLDKVIKAIAHLTNTKLPINYKLYEDRSFTIENNLPPRPPTLCPGCPHRASYYALKKAASMAGIGKFIGSSDIGCYALGVLPPIKVGDVLYDMGSSIGIGHGLAKAQDRFVIAIIGDSTFYHAGLPAVLNAVYNKSPLLILVLDNHVTAMTGQQPHPGTGIRITGEPSRRILIEDIAKGLGVRYVRVGDPLKVNDFKRILSEAMIFVKKNSEPALVVARSPCTLYELRRMVIENVKPRLYAILEDKCTGCTACADYFGCPAISMIGGKASIDPELCTGCGACVYSCPFNAIIEVERR